MLVVLKYGFWLLSTTLAFAGAWFVKFTKERAGADRLELTHSGRIALPIAIAALMFGFVLQIAETVAAHASKLDDISHRDQLESSLLRVHEQVANVTGHLASLVQRSPQLAQSLAADPAMAHDVDSFFDLAQRIDPSLKEKIDLTRRFAKGDLRLSPLEAAVESGDERKAQIVLAAGANVDERGDLGLTPLQRAAAEGKLQLTELLLDQGAVVNARSTFLGETALMKAAMSGRAEIVRLLIDRGAEIDMQDKYGETALFHSACYNRSAVVELLLSRGASATIVNKQGKTPLACAENFHAKDTTKILREVTRHLTRR